MINYSLFISQLEVCGVVSGNQSYVQIIIFLFDSGKEFLFLFFVFEVYGIHQFCERSATDGIDANEIGKCGILYKDIIKEMIKVCIVLNAYLEDFA